MTQVKLEQSLRLPKDKDEDWGVTPELEEEVVFAAIASMEAARMAMVSEPGSACDDFGIRQRVKTKEAAASSGDAGYDAAQAVARNDLALDFCRGREVQSTYLPTQLRGSGHR